ncbi:MAG: flagellar biosynthesis protein FliQ [Bacteroidota bacterium]
MNTEVALFWVQEALTTSTLVLAPLLGMALFVGLAVSLFQAITSIQEMTLSYIPKLLVVAILLFLLTPWMLTLLTDFTVNVFGFIPNVSR